MFSVAVGNIGLCSLVDLEGKWSNNFLLLILAIHNSFIHINTDRKYKTLNKATIPFITVHYINIQAQFSLPSTFPPKR